jgi:hypothetical protein
MVKFILLSTIFLGLITFLKAQEFAKFSITDTNKGTGNFTIGCIPNFTWEATGTVNSVNILNNEEFDDGNEFEKRFGQANNSDNIRIQGNPNGAGTSGTPIRSKFNLTLNFDKPTTTIEWGFCVVDIDVENCLISAIDKSGKEVDKAVINTWLVELFDTDTVADGLNIPKWDASNAALLGSDTDEEYLVYDSIVTNGIPASEAAAAFFMPNIPLKSLIIELQNLQPGSYTSFHFYIAANCNPTATQEILFEEEFRIFPNPSRGSFTIQSSMLKQGSGKIEILDLNGRKVFEKYILTGPDNTEIDAESLKKGVYLCRLIMEKGSVTKKLIIQ